MAQADTAANLVKLGDTDLTVADSAADVRGRTAVDRNGEELGKVDALLVDDQEFKVRFLRIAAGGLLGIGAQHFLVPVDAVKNVDQDRVHIDRDRAGMSDVPGYDPELAADPDYYAGVYDWWGYGPYWGAGYAYPPYPYYRY